ncbi:MAG: hypothetical protein JSS95_14080 [Acidobacteria bacterium]|nr:hypothetical protein [Acidobacteriota bacterium]
MPVPSIIHAYAPVRKLTGATALGLSLLFVTNSAVAKGPGSTTSIPLEPLGFQLPQTQFLLAGSTMMTLDFVDDQHLLLTYSAKRLLKRLPDCPPSDQDRVIDAVLIALPEGKAVAHTSWRVHDRGQYLWNLGRGRFMLRNRDTLTTIAPAMNNAKGNAFRESPFIETKRRIDGVVLSPDADLLVLETLEPLPPTSGLEEAASASPATSSGSDPSHADKPVQINFFKLRPANSDEVQITPGAAARARTPGRIPANAAGYLSILDQGQQHWAFDFNGYDGTKKELAPFDSTCRPVPMLVSRGEFIAFGCHLSHTPQVIAGFNMRGEEMWEQNMTETYISPTFAFAPEAGRFAFSRVITHTSLVTDETIMPELVDSQSIIVYQTESGRQILQVKATPVARAGQNFALAPDGMSLAVIRTDAIEVYTLPPPTGKEREAMKLAEAATPKAKDDAPISSAMFVASPAAATESTNSIAPAEPKPPAAVDSAAGSSASPAPTSPAEPASTPAVNSQATATRPSGETAKSDDDTSDKEQKPRKPPTLYNEPGEHGATGSSKPASPQ